VIRLAEINPSAARRQGDPRERRRTAVRAALRQRRRRSDRPRATAMVISSYGSVRRAASFVHVDRWTAIGLIRASVAGRRCGPPSGDSDVDRTALGRLRRRSDSSSDVA